ncbi:DUF1015 domain-containing protein [Edaphobacter modestus]|uniref:Uncharacterized protein (DUF1015 family) n=1 Tax=Edaphobacter modestus TaxID=388466 RepID=A0A4Q7YSS8_9BACT|nr:DUF1015 domain-containing protein [Edaphobacter modestus]RZU40071.1 uncharacterized protein (DUF1015 family) [Edaphobacter modestus]
MARIYPFRALRYDPARVNMEEVVTQPYDKISPAMQDRYYDASPYNLVRVILGKHLPGDNDQENVYTRAAETLRAWRKESVLEEEAEPALYGYSQTYTVPHTSEVRERRGFIALGHLYDYADKVVYRHEQTFPKHKSDRMSLFKATRTYCEQIYMLYSDPAFTAEKLIFGVSEPDGKDNNPADLAITDEYGVVHRVWKLTDPNLINLIVTAMADKKLIIADGHHRYETSVAYAQERSAQLKLPLNQPRDEEEKISPGHLPAPSFPEAAMMMTFVNMDAPGITILPTHRVVYGIEGFSSPDFLTRASAYFEVKELASHDVAVLAETDRTAFVAVTIDGSYLLTAKPDRIDALLQDLPLRQRQLDVVQLHRVVLDKLLGLDQETITRLGSVSYLREADEAASMVTEGDANIAFLIKSITLEQLKDVSLAGDVMPQKSTDFYPKLLSGLAIYALD